MNFLEIEGFFESKHKIINPLSFNLTLFKKYSQKSLQTYNLLFFSAD